MTELETRLIAQRDRAARAVAASAPNSTQEELDKMQYTARRLADYQVYGWLAY